MKWLPRHPDFRGALKSAVAKPDAEALVALSRHELSYLETIQLDNAIARARERLVGTLPQIRLALLSSATVDHLAPAIRVAAMRRGLLLDVLIGPYGQFRQAVLDANSSLHAFAPQIVVFSVDAREATSRVAIGASASDVTNAVASICDELAALWRQLRARHAATVIQQTVLDVSEPLFGSHDRLVPSTPGRVIQRVNDALVERAAQEQVLVLDIARISAGEGLDRWFDRSRWLQGKIEIAPPMAPLYGEHVARLVAASRGQSKKCLVLDLDNTLWGGVIGDDGLEGIKIGEGSAIGEAHLALQRYAKMLRQRGVILAVCSKNDPRIAEAAFNEHPEMALRRSDIAAFAANWNDKAENLRAIAEQLNIGLDSLVFVDDNPVERARIREALPMVSVPELTPDPADYVHALAQAGYFEAVSFTDEDRERADQYTANAEREALRGVAKTMDDFLRDLDMTSVCGPARSVDLIRVTQLLNKTNQFNTTTRRYSQDEVARLADSEIVLQFRLADRFGDNGLVSVMILKGDPGRSDRLALENWVMSCRVFGRQLEDAALNVAVEMARARGARTLEAAFIPTAKNEVVADLYERLGFSCAARDEGGGSRWMLDLGSYAVRPTFIKVQVQ